MGTPDNTDSAAWLFDSDADADFLTETLPTGDAFTILNDHRQQISAWSAAAFINRHPECASYRGHKGILAAEQDLDFHLQHLRDACRAEDPAFLRRYADWIVAVMQRRAVPAKHVQLGVAVLSEGIRRHLQWPVGDELADRLTAAFEEV